jgi:uncharacterized ferredoxin-like protein
MIKHWKNANLEAILLQLELLLQAAKTAPKARGVDNLAYMLVTESDLEVLAKKMEDIAQRDNKAFFARDAQNIRKSLGVILLGAKNTPKNLDCGFCGFTCSTKPELVPCSKNIVDLGIAIGSLTALAATFHLDNRVMYSAAKAALELGWLENVTNVYAIPFSVSEKNIYFDRK